MMFIIHVYLIMCLYGLVNKLTLALLFKCLEKSRMGTILLEFRGIRLVINQSVVPVN